MTGPIKISWICLGLAGLGFGLRTCFNRAGWDRKTRQLAESLRHPAQETKQEIQTITFAGFHLLPEPVAKYLRFALKEGQPVIRSVRLSQTGELRGLERSKARWMPFKASQFYWAQPPGFVWDARVRAFPWMPIRVRDAYAAGQGVGQVSAFSLLTLAEEHGSPEFAEGALMRYLAESVWFPTALLPSAHLAWTPIDGNTSRATLTDGSITVFLEFRFNEIGEVSGVYTPGRYRATKGKYELTPWGGQHRCYEERNGMRVPIEAEVEWHLPDGIVSVWKSRIDKVTYEYAE